MQLHSVFFSIFGGKPLLLLIQTKFPVVFVVDSPCKVFVVIPHWTLV